MHWSRYTTRRFAQYVTVSAGVALLSLSSLLLTEYWLTTTPSQKQQWQQYAMQQMQHATALIKEEKSRLGVPISTEDDPNHTGLIGEELTDMTTTQGSLRAKRTTTNPAFAALIVHLLLRANVKKGEAVAIAFSGSFPALNIAVLAAIDALQLQPVIISSIGASAYGANQVAMTWLDMENTLVKRGLWHYQSVAASLGGIVETEGGLGGEGIKWGLEAIQRNGVPLLNETGQHAQLEQEINSRLKLYQHYTKQYAAFINVGGGITSLGWLPEAAKLNHGLLTSLPTTQHPSRGVIFHMHEHGIPVIHLLNIERLAKHYHLPIDPIPLSHSSTPLLATQTDSNTLKNQALVMLILYLFALILCPKEPLLASTKPHQE